MSFPFRWQLETLWLRPLGLLTDHYVGDVQLRSELTHRGLAVLLFTHPKKKKKIFNTISWTTQDFSKISSCSVFLPEIENDVIHIWLASGLLINDKISQAEVKKQTHTHTHTHTHTSVEQFDSIFFKGSCALVQFSRRVDGEGGTGNHPEQRHQILWMVNNKYLCLCSSWLTS